MKLQYAADPVRFERMNSQEIKETFLLDDLFVAAQVNLTYWFVDRAVVGGIVPIGETLKLKAGEEMACEYFAQRREIGIINIGSNGTVSVDGNDYAMENKDGLYIGLGSKDIQFASNNPDEPARFYLISYPAHKAYPTTQAKAKDAQTVNLGTPENANVRTIYKYIHPDGIKSCQLVMGVTLLESGNVWNTMPAHTHIRRTEVYMYFDVGDDSLVFHYMGKPNETRHIAVRDSQAVLSPSWSIHSGVGLKNYSFVWAMGGENQKFDDMQGISLDEVR